MKLNKTFYTGEIIWVSLLLFILSTANAFATDLAPTGRISPLVDQYLNDNVAFSIKVSNLNVVTAYANEWHVEVTVKNSNGTVVYTDTIPGQDISPGQEIQVISSQTWSPGTADEYEVIFHVKYIYEINPSNDIDQYYFNVWAAPSPASIFLPENGATGVSYNPPPTLSGQSGNVPVQNTTVNLNSVPPMEGQSFSSSVNSNEISLTPDQNLLPGTQYQWTVDQTNPSGTTQNGPFTFTTEALPMGKVRGKKFNDQNGNGIQDEGEPGLSGWVITFNDSEYTTTTDSAGNFELSIRPGTYTVKEKQQTDWVQTYPTNPNFYTINLADSQTIEHIDFGNRPAISPIGIIPIFPQDQATGISSSPPPTLSWNKNAPPLKTSPNSVQTDSQFIPPVTSTTIMLSPVPPDTGKSFTETFDKDTNSYTPLENLEFDTKYQWTVKQTNADGTTESGPFTFTTGLAVSVESKELIPKKFELEQNYPNPFNPTTNFEFQTANFGLVTLKLYDVLGNEVATIVNEEKPAGNYKVTFDASNLPSGVYFYKIKAGNFVKIKKMVLLR